MVTKYASLKGDFKDDVIGKLDFLFKDPVSDIAMSDFTILYTLSQNGKDLCMIEMPEEGTKKVECVKLVLFYLV